MAKISGYGVLWIGISIVVVSNFMVFYFMGIEISGFLRSSETSTSVSTNRGVCEKYHSCSSPDECVGKLDCVHEVCVDPSALPEDSPCRFNEDCQSGKCGISVIKVCEEIPPTSFDVLVGVSGSYSNQGDLVIKFLNGIVRDDPKLKKLPTTPHFVKLDNNNKDTSQFIVDFQMYSRIEKLQFFVNTHPAKDMKRDSLLALESNYPNLYLLIGRNLPIASQCVVAKKNTWDLTATVKAYHQNNYLNSVTENEMIVIYMQNNQMTKECEQINLNSPKLATFFSSQIQKYVPDENEIECEEIEKEICEKGEVKQCIRSKPGGSPHLEPPKKYGDLVKSLVLFDIAIVGGLLLVWYLLSVLFGGKNLEKTEKGTKKIV